MAVPLEEGTPRLRRTRNPNYRSTIYQTKDGYWHGRVTIGIRDDGQPDRRHVGGKTRSEVAEKVRALERERDRGTVRKAGERWTVGRWLTYWVENIAAPPHVAENTHNGYLVDVNKHLIPGLGAHRLERLTPDHVERLYAKLQRDGLSPGGVHHVHRTLRAALNEAVRRSHLTRNPVLLAKAPKLDADDVEPYDVPEIQRLLETAARRRNGARWALALALGLRQGEALGLTWDDVDLKKGTIRIHRSRLRPKYAHGCGGACGKKPGYCPQRVNARAATGRVKSKAGRRTIGLPPQLVALLQAHQAEQEQERASARQIWHGEGWVFAAKDGKPLNPNTDYHEWKRLLKEAGLREARLHDARHTAALRMKRRGVALNATSWARREDDAAGDPASGLSPSLMAGMRETADQGGYARTRLHQRQRRCIQFRCVRCQHVASSSSLKQQRRGKRRHSAVGRAEVFGMVGNPLPTSCRDESLTMRDVQVILGHAHLSTTADVYLVEDEAEVIRRVRQHLAAREQHVQPAAPPPAAAGYDAGDLSVLFGGILQ